MGILEFAWSFVSRWALDFLGNLMLCEFLLCMGLPRRHNFWWRIAAVLPVFAIPAIFRRITGESPYLLEIFFIGWYSYCFIPIFLISTLLIWFCFKRSYLQILYHCTAAYALQNLGYACRLLVTDVLKLESGTQLYSNYMLLVSVGVWIFAYFSFERKTLKNDVYIAEKFPLPVAFLTLMIVNFAWYWAYAFDMMSQATMMYSLFCSIFLLVVQFGIFDRSKAEQEKMVMEQMYVAMERQRKQSMDSMDLINHKCHDLKHQVRLLRSSVISMEEKEGILEDLEQAVMLYDSVAKTGNQVFDAVLTEKSLQCEQHGINLTYIADGQSLAFMHATDVYSLFGNALDNAIECQMGEEPQNRIISLNVAVKSSFLTVNIENFCSNLPQIQKGLPVSSKPRDGNHGFGTKSIQAIVGKYGGRMSIQLDEALHRFSLFIWIPT